MEERVRLLSPRGVISDQAVLDGNRTAWYIDRAILLDRDFVPDINAGSWVLQVIAIIEVGKGAGEGVGRAGNKPDYERGGAVEAELFLQPSPGFPSARWTGEGHGVFGVPGSCSGHQTGPTGIEGPVGKSNVGLSAGGVGQRGGQQQRCKNMQNGFGSVSLVIHFVSPLELRLMRRRVSSSPLTHQMRESRKTGSSLAFNGI